jgi:hypothetical protein
MGQSVRLYCELQFPRISPSQPVLTVLPSGMGFRLNEAQLARVERFGWFWLPDTDFVVARDLGSVYVIADRFSAAIRVED